MTSASKIMEAILNEGKTCTRCGKWKVYSEFHNMKRASDGKQFRCKTCFKETNKQFRKEKPEYQLEYQKQNPDKLYKAMDKYRRGDETTVYAIQTPLGSYIGVTTQNIKVRLRDHVKGYKQHKEGIRSFLPKFFEALDNFTYDEAMDWIKNPIKLEVVKGRNLRKAHQLETKWIKKYQKEGKKLLNMHKT